MYRYQTRQLTVWKFCLFLTFEPLHRFRRSLSQMKDLSKTNRLIYSFVYVSLTAEFSQQKNVFSKNSAAQSGIDWDLGKRYQKSDGERICIEHLCLWEKSSIFEFLPSLQFWRQCTNVPRVSGFSNLVGSHVKECKFFNFDIFPKLHFS